MYMYIYTVYTLYIYICIYIRLRHASLRSSCCSTRPSVSSLTLGAPSKAVARTPCACSQRLVAPFKAPNLMP